MLHIVDFDADEALLGVQRENTHVVALVLTSVVQAVFHGRISTLLRLALLLKTRVSSLKNAESWGKKFSGS